MILSNYKSVKNAYIDASSQNVFDMDWEEMVAFLSYHRKAEKKDDVELFNLGEFKTLADPTCELGRKYHYVNGERQETFDPIPNTIRRCKENLIQIWGIVLDFDSNVTILDAMDKYNEYEWVLYTTFRNLTEKNEKGELIQKFRMVLPFSNPLMRDDIPKYRRSIEQMFPDVDGASFSVSQTFYYHSGPYPFTHHNRGRIIDPYTEYIITLDPNTQSQSYEGEILSSEEMGSYKKGVMDSLRSCRDVHYRSIVALATICKSIQMTWPEFDMLVDQISATGSALNKRSVRQQVWGSVTTTHCRAQTRDEFIKNHNGKPFVMLREGPLPTDYVMRQLRKKPRII
jgi:hypothetical protein